MLRVLIPIDGSENSLRAVGFVVRKAALYKGPLEIHLLNVQHPFPGTIRGVHKEAEQFHHDEGLKALAGARKALDAAGLKHVYHISVGEAGEAIAHFARDKHIEQIVMGTRGAGSIANMLLGSVTTKVLHLVDVPVLLVK
ncbi:MAG: universal stress protein [Sulfuricaulis sp.]|nr:universal stress protein [Sulfuricaulis sp.]